MNNNLLNIVKRITAQYGESILGDSARLKPLFADLAKDEPKPLRIAFGRCIEAGAYNVFKTAPNTADRITRKTTLAQNLRNQHSIDPLLSGEALDILEAALYGTASSAQQPQYTQPPQQPASAPQSTTKKKNSGVIVDAIGGAFIGAIFGYKFGAFLGIAGVAGILLGTVVGIVAGVILGAIWRAIGETIFGAVIKGSFYGIIVGAFLSVALFLGGVDSGTAYSDAARLGIAALGGLCGAVLGAVIGVAYWLFRNRQKKQGSL